MKVRRSHVVKLSRMSALVGKHMEESPVKRKSKTVGLTHPNAGSSCKTECPINIPAISIAHCWSQSSDCVDLGYPQTSGHSSPSGHLQITPYEVLHHLLQLHGWCIPTIKNIVAKLKFTFFVLRLFLLFLHAQHLRWCKYS